MVETRETWGTGLGKEVDRTGRQWGYGSGLKAKSQMAPASGFLGLAQENGVFSILYQLATLTCLEHILEWWSLTSLGSWISLGADKSHICRKTNITHNSSVFMDPLATAPSPLFPLTPDPDLKTTVFVCFSFYTPESV